MKALATVLAAAVAAVGLAAAPAGAAPSPGHCWGHGVFNGYASAGEATALPDIDNLPTFTDKRCNVNTPAGQVRIDVVGANTPAEVAALRRTVIHESRGFRTPWLFCPQTKRKAYVVNWRWHTTNITERPGEPTLYTRWAMKWKADHGCVRSFVRDY